MSFILADCVQRERMDLKFSVRTHPSGGSPENPIGTMFLPTRWSISLRWINMSRELGMMVCVWKKSVVWRSINCQHLFLDSWVKCLLFLYSNLDTHQRLFSQNLVQPQNWNFPRPDQQNDDVNNQGSFSLISSKLLSFWSANTKKVFVYRQLKWYRSIPPLLLMPDSLFCLNLWLNISHYISFSLPVHTVSPQM